MGISRTRLLTAIALAALLADCSDDGSSSAPPAKTESVFKSQTDAMEKAKQVEQITLDAAKQQQKDIEEQAD